MAFTYRDMGHVFHEYILRIFHNGWMNCRDAYHAALCLYYCVMDKNIAEYEAYWLMGFPIINLWGTRFTSVFSIFSVMHGWRDCRDTFHAVLCLCNKRKKAEYEANWLISVPIIDYRGPHQLSFPAKRYTQIKQLKLLCFQKSKQTSIRKIL